MTVASLLRASADDQSSTSLSHRLRTRRFEQFERMAATLPRPLAILDIGGTTEFWENRGWAGLEDVHITLVNLVAAEQRHDHIVPTVGDATDLSQYADNSFDLVFSNSVIEHLFALPQQEAMAREVRRLAPAYWIQTPNYWFPMEPHFLVPGWQFIPERIRVEILRRRSVGWAGHTPDRAKAEEAIREVRLLRRRELKRMFGDATLTPERFGGLVKSWTAARVPAATSA
jgi:hypothetical protein